MAQKALELLQTAIEGWLEFVSVVAVFSDHLKEELALRDADTRDGCLDNSVSVVVEVGVGGLAVRDD